jgi:hypothetical protein
MQDAGILRNLLHAIFHDPKTVLLAAADTFSTGAAGEGVRQRGDWSPLFSIIHV